MADFLTADQLYRVLQRELPEDVYIDGPATAGFSTADNYATAELLADAYVSASAISLNYFPQTSVDFIGDWEVTCFDQISAGLALTARQNAVIAHLRNRPGITKKDMFNACTATLPFLAPSGVEIMVWNSASGCWFISESELDISTFLNGENMVDAVGSNLCEGATDPAEFGKTADEWAIIQQQAYTYEARIYNFVLTAQQRSALDRVLTVAEPARSTHVITDNLTDADRINGYK